MAYSVVATWRVSEGKEAEMVELLRKLTKAVGAEPGCRFHQVQRHLADPRSFLLYAIYDDRAAFDTHLATEHVKQLGLTEAMALRDEREPSQYYETAEFD